MVVLTPEQQELFVRTEPKTFTPVIAQGREDLAAHAKVRMAHMRGFERLGQAERHAPEFVRRHRPAIRKRDEMVRSTLYYCQRVSRPARCCHERPLRTR